MPDIVWRMEWFEKEKESSRGYWCGFIVEDNGMLFYGTIPLGDSSYVTSPMLMNEYQLNKSLGILPPFRKIQRYLGKIYDSIPKELLERMKEGEVLRSL